MNEIENRHRHTELDRTGLDTATPAVYDRYDHAMRQALESRAADPLDETTPIDPSAQVAPIGDGLVPPAPPADEDEEGGQEHTKPAAISYGAEGPAPVPPLDEAAAPESKDEQPITPGKTCACGVFEVVNPETDEVVEATLCERPTSRKFAPGHDAKLKSLLIRAGVAGHRVREAGTTRLHRPTTIATRFGFGEMVDKAIRKRTGR